MGAVTVLAQVFRMVFGNLRTLVILAFWGGVPLALAGLVLQPVINRGFPLEGNAIAAFVAMWIIYAVIFVWFAVHWHRALLTGKHPNPVWPGVPLRGMLAYVLWTVLIWILLVIVLLVPSFLLVNAASMFLPEDIGFPPSFADLLPLYIASAIANLIFFYVSIRFAPVLPAAALDRQISSSEAALATADRGAPLLALLVLVVSIAAGGLTNAVLPLLPIGLQGAAAGIWQAASALFFLTLLTAIYHSWMPTEDAPGEGPDDGATRIEAY